MITKYFARQVIALLLLALGAGAIAQTPAVTGTITTQNLVPAGTATPGSCVAIEVNNKGVATVQVAGTYTGALSGQVTINETAWTTLAPTPFIPATALGTPAATITSGATGIWEVAGIAGKQLLRICALGAVTGSATVTLNTSPATPASLATISGGAGDASAANQVTGNASLASIDGKLVGGAGAVGATVLRTTQASDSPLVATLGAVADAAATQGSTGTVSAKLREISSSLGTINTSLGTLNTSVNATPSYEDTPGTSISSTGLVILGQSGANSATLPIGSASVAVNMSTATTTQHVALSGTTLIRVTGIVLVAGGTTNVTFAYGTGTNCGTGTTSISGAMPLVANSGLSIGSGVGAVLVIPSGQALCITNSAAVQLSGWITYTQF